MTAIIAKKTYTHDLATDKLFYPRRGLHLHSVNQADRFIRYVLHILQFEHLPDHSEDIYPQLLQL
jgi:hypothetical protein